MSSDGLERLARLVQTALEAKRGGDLASEIEALCEVDSEQDNALHLAVERAFKDGWTQRQVAEILGVTQQSVSERFGRRSSS